MQLYILQIAGSLNLVTTQAASASVAFPVEAPFSVSADRFRSAATFTSTSSDGLSASRVVALSTADVETATDSVVGTPASIGAIAVQDCNGMGGHWPDQCQPHAFLDNARSPSLEVPLSWPPTATVLGRGSSQPVNPEGRRGTFLFATHYSKRACILSIAFCVLGALDVLQH